MKVWQRGLECDDAGVKRAWCGREEESVAVQVWRNYGVAEKRRVWAVQCSESVVGVRQAAERWQGITVLTSVLLFTKLLGGEERDRGKEKG